METRDRLIEIVELTLEKYSGHDDWYFESVEIADALIAAGVGFCEAVTGETSDGYHTFNELYHHRAVLFSVICSEHKDMAWKSRKHYDGTMFDGMFIVGINTPEGQATYHYDLNPYWDMFDVREIDHAPEWDGHTASQAIERIGALKQTKCDCKYLEDDYCIYWGAGSNTCLCQHYEKR